MPLPGGPSDKLGNRYELRWIVRHFVDLVTGRLQWLRIEPPGDDAIEFRSCSRQGETAYQVKRGISGGGHWSLAAVRKVLDGFGALLGADPDLECVFASAHSAPELQELCDRARSSRSAVEFSTAFLDAKWLKDAWDDLCSRWNVDAVTAWSRIRRIRVATMGEQELQESTDALLQLLFDAPPETARAALTDLALNSVHDLLKSNDVAKCLAQHSISRRATGTTNAIAPTVSPPPASGVLRTSELERITSLIADGKATVLLEGLSGMGKSTVAAQFAQTWPGPACWLDCALLSSPADAIATVSEFLARSLGEQGLAQASAGAAGQIGVIGGLVGRLLAAKRCLLVWDGLDGARQAQFGPLVDAIASTIPTGGAQLVTAQEHRDSGKATIASFAVARLDKQAVRRLLTDTFPDARAADIEAADEVTSGHPYIVQLLIDAATTLSLGAALQSMRSEPRTDSLLSTLIGQQPEPTRKLLRSLTWLGIPFGVSLVERLGGSVAELRDLAVRHLVVRSGGETYRVHELVSRLIVATTHAGERADLHQRAALALRSLDHPSWHEVQALLRHARAASMSDMVREAAMYLLQYATNHGDWWMAREAAESLVSDGSTDYFPYFVLGKACRMTGDLEQALAHYEHAERYALADQEREVARFDRASVLYNLGRSAEAEPLFQEMLESTIAGTRIHARIALALGMSERGERLAARRLLEEALTIPTEPSADRARADAHHAIARLDAAQGDFVKAREHVREAYAIRYNLKGPEAFDVLGSFHLYNTALEVERALGNRAAARSAAHGLWRYALLSGSIPWEASACQALCINDPNDEDPEVIAALAHLRMLQADQAVPLPLRVTLLTSLVLCEWSLTHYEAALEAILTLLALANEQNVDVPIFGHVTTDKEHEEKVGLMPNGYVLLLPLGAGMEFFDAKLARVVERRPELAQHAQVVMGRVRPEKRRRAKSGHSGRRSPASNRAGSRRRKNR